MIILYSGRVKVFLGRSVCETRALIIGPHDKLHLRQDEVPLQSSVFSLLV